MELLTLDGMLNAVVVCDVELSVVLFYGKRLEVGSSVCKIDVLPQLTDIKAVENEHSRQIVLFVAVDQS